MKRPPPASLASSGAVSGSFSSLRSSPPSFFFCLGSRSSVLSAPSSAAFSLPLPPPRLFFPYPFCFLSFFFLPSLPQSPFFPIPPSIYLSFGSFTVTESKPISPTHSPPNNKNTQPGGKAWVRAPGGKREGRGPQQRGQPERGAERAAPARLPPGELSAIGRAGCIKLLAINKARVRLCKAQILICKVLKIFKWKGERGAGGRAGAARGEGGREGGRAGAQASWGEEEAARRPPARLRRTALPYRCSHR